MPFTLSASSPFTFPTAVLTPLPPKASPPSRSSTASNSPVDAPDGTIACPAAPDFSNRSTSTVGLPRLSRTWRAGTRSISLIGRRVLPVPGTGRPHASARAPGRGRARSRSSVGAFYLFPVAVGRTPQLELGVGAGLDGVTHSSQQPRAVVVAAGIALQTSALRALQDLLGVQRRGQRRGDLAEDLAPALVVALDLAPVAHDVAGAVRGP